MHVNGGQMNFRFVWQVYLCNYNIPYGENALSFVLCDAVNSFHIKIVTCASQLINQLKTELRGLHYPPKSWLWTEEQHAREVSYSNKYNSGTTAVSIGGGRIK